jgi:hypothetical protein
MVAQSREMAARFFNEVWALLDRPYRDAEDDLRMIHLAHASRAHWQTAGGPREWAIGEWQIARVYAVIGRGEPALYHATIGMAMTSDGALGLFLEGCAHEVMARACQAAGRTLEAARHHTAATEIAARLTDPEERELLELDLRGGR